MNPATPHLLPPGQLDLRVVFISSYPPRKCGIATYTKDLATGINSLNPDRLAEIIALDNPISEELDYPWEVSHRIRQNNWEDYEKVLTYLNNSTIDVVCLQHEYGIWGGPDGEYIVDFVRKLKKPIVITLHTVLDEPSPNQKRILEEICKKAHATVVMLPVAKDILKRVYNIPSEKVVAIHHGAPDIPFAGPEEAKKQLGLEDRIVMTNVNLLGPGRGVEYAIQALLEVVKKYPNFLYLIVGQTHPVVLKERGESYREMLHDLVKKLKLTKNVQFVNEYVSLDDLVTYVKASDFYITPYEGLAQISSGALAYAIAAGKICISTPYLYAIEMLAGGKGYLVEPKNSQSITEAILQALDHPNAMQVMRQKCYAQGRKMTWTRVGFRYLRTMDKAAKSKPTTRYTKPTLQYLQRLTLAHGVIEHTHYHWVRHKEGYSVDDNARALIAAIQYGNKPLAQKYLGFLVSAQKDGKMYCDLTSKGTWHGEPGDGDWFGRAFWAAAYAMRFASSIRIRKEATQLVRNLLPTCKQVRSLRTLAYILLGLCYLQEAEWDELAAERLEILNQSIEKILFEYHAHSSVDWVWPDSIKAYDNARIPQALLEVSRTFNRPDLKELGLQILNFVIDSNFDVLGNHFRFIGNNGWLKKGESKALWDEQPIEAGATAQACFTAYRVSGLNYYKQMGTKAFAWFYGDNIHRRPLVNQRRQSVYDGLNPEGINLNQGAESLLEYLLAYTSYANVMLGGITTGGQTNTT